MELKLDVPPLCLKSNSDGSKLVVGFVDGSVRFYEVNDDELEEIWRFQTKTSVRGVDIDEKNEQVYAVTKNRALCVFDIHTGKRTRCILKCHSSSPTSVCVLPPTALKNQQVATGDEKGEVKTWNMRAEDPVVRKWKHQEEDINDLKVDIKSNLIATSSDGTIGAYDLRKGIFKVRSEAMHSEMLAICPTKRFVYVGGEDGYVEVFNLSEYGNLLERIESGFEMGVNGIVELRAGLLLLTSFGSNKLRLLNVMPSKRLGALGAHGDEKNDDDGIDAISLSADKNFLFTAVSMGCSIKRWDLQPIVDKIPILRAQDAKKKKNQKKEGFFEDLLATSAKAGSDSDEDGEDEDEEEEEEDEEEIEDEENEDEDDSDEQEPNAKKRRIELENNSDLEDEEFEDEEDESDME